MRKRRRKSKRRRRRRRRRDKDGADDREQSTKGGRGEGWGGGIDRSPFSVVKHLKLLSQNPQMSTTSPAAEQMKQDEEADILWSRGSPRRTFNPDTEQEG